MTDRNQVVVECDKCGEIIARPENATFPYGTIEAIKWYDKHTSVRWTWRVPDLCRGCMEKARELLTDNGFAVQSK